MAARKRSMPASVKIGPFSYGVVSDSDAHLTAEMKHGARLDGRSQANDLTIHVNPQHAPTYQKSTMIHEILHQVFVVSGALLDEEAEERICRHLEGGLLGVFQDNPDLVGWLAARD